MTEVTRRTVLKNLALGGAALATAPSLNARINLRKQGRPNVLLLVSDQERSWMDLPGSLDLPAHDKLLNRGTGFNQYYVNTSPCSPSRSVMYSGQHTMRTGMTANLHAPPFPSFNQELPTLGHLFQELGYIADRMVAGEASQWLVRDSQKLDKPWLLAVNFVNPHDIMFFSSGEKQEQSRANPRFMAPLRPPPNDPIYRKDWSHLPLPASFAKETLRDKPWCHRSYAQVIDSIYGHMDKDDEAAWLANQSYYFNCIRDVSRQVDHVLQALEDSGQLDNTIIVYTADHGEMAGAHGLRQKGPVTYKENSRVPLIVSHPDVSGGRTVDNLGSALDLVPTLVGLATEGKTTTDTPGVDLSPALGGHSTRRDQDGILFAYGVLLYTDPEATQRLAREGDEITPVKLMGDFLKQLRLGPELGNRGLHRGVFDGRYKFTRYFSPDSHHLPRDWDTLLAHNDLELYDTHQDPDELVNLAARPEGPEAVKERLLALNDRTNQLIEQEIGDDHGGEYPGPEFMYRL